MSIFTENKIVLRVQKHEIPLIKEAVEKVRYVGYEMEVEESLGIHFDEKNVGHGAYLMEVKADDPLAFYLLGFYSGECLKKQP